MCLMAPLPLYLKAHHVILALNGPIPFCPPPPSLNSAPLPLRRDRMFVSVGWSSLSGCVS